MAVLLFYFPGAGQASHPRKWFEQAGLGSMLSTLDEDPLCNARPDEDPACAEGSVNGPDGGLGRLAFWSESTPNPLPKPIAVEKDRQVWYRAPKKGNLAAGRFWVGYWKDQPIEPVDLVRRRPLPGVEVPLGRFLWTVPTARNLPRVFSYDDEGAHRWTLEKEAHVRYFDEARRLMEAINASCTESHFTYDMEEHLAFTVQALQINYRVSLEVLDLMKAIRQDELCVAAQAASGMPISWVDVKKNAVSIDPGETA